MIRLMVGIGLVVTVLGWGLLVQGECDDGLPAGKTWAEGEQLAQPVREHLPGSVFRDCTECPEMVVVPPGRFRMGDLNGRGAIDEYPVHDVTIACPFAVGKYEVTFAEWDACVAAGGCTHWRWGRDARPVRDVSWKDTQEYVRWLSRETGKFYRLLSEAEWEYVARAETTTEYWWGNEADHNYANYGKDERDYNFETDMIDPSQVAGKDRWKGTAPVGSFEPNAFGLFDTAGNVSEWVEDCDHDSYAGAPNDGSAWTSEDCENRVSRGGSYVSSPRYLRSATRDGNMPGFPGLDDIGFRVARTLGVAQARDRDREAARKKGADDVIHGLLAGKTWAEATDDAAFARAQSRGTLEAYAEYSAIYPSGRHVEAARRLQAFRKRYPLGTIVRDCTECPKMVVVPAGRFQMGVSSGDSCGYERPVHDVTIAYPFAVGKYEVTFAEWDACVATGGCQHRPDEDSGRRGSRPVINVSWWDAQEYVVWLSRKTGKPYRLLSEAEWEYVARAGSTTRFPWGDDMGDHRANCDDCDRWGSVGPVPVGRFEPNWFGLFDTAGNVWEWVEDCWNENYAGAPANGRAWMSGDCDHRVVRGGSWSDSQWLLRSATRNRDGTGGRNRFIGFRIARTLD